MLRIQLKDAYRCMEVFILFFFQVFTQDRQIYISIDLLIGNTFLFAIRSKYCLFLSAVSSIWTQQGIFISDTSHPVFNCP